MRKQRRRVTAKLISAFVFAIRIVGSKGVYTTRTCLHDDLLCYGFEGGIRVLFEPVPGHCIPVTFNLTEPIARIFIFKFK